MRASGAQPVRTEDKKSPCRAGGPSKDAGAPCRAVHTPRVGRGGSDKTKPESLRRDSVARRCEAQRSRRRPPSAPSRAAQCSEEPGRAQHHTRKQLANGDARRHRVVVRRVRAAPCFRVRRQLRRGIGVSAGLLADVVISLTPGLNMKYVAPAGRRRAMPSTGGGRLPESRESTMVDGTRDLHVCMQVSARVDVYITV